MTVELFELEERVGKSFNDVLSSFYEKYKIDFDGYVLKNGGDIPYVFQNTPLTVEINHGEKRLTSLYRVYLEYNRLSDKMMEFSKTHNTKLKGQDWVIFESIMNDFLKIDSTAVSIAYEFNGYNGKPLEIRFYAGNYYTNPKIWNKSLMKSAITSSEILAKPNVTNMAYHWFNMILQEIERRKRYNNPPLTLEAHDRYDEISKVIKIITSSRSSYIKETKK